MAVPIRKQVDAIGMVVSTDTLSNEGPTRGGDALANRGCLLGTFRTRGEGYIIHEGVTYPNLRPLGTHPRTNPCGIDW